jgi:hypothetical protein
VDIGRSHVAVEGHTEAEGIPAQQLLIDDDRILESQAEPPIFLREPWAKETLFSHSEPEPAGNGSLSLPFRD